MILLALLLAAQMVQPSPFYREDGWVGGDAAYSAGDLWFFGDSFEGRIRNGRREIDRMAHNSVRRGERFWFDFYPGYSWPGAAVLYRGKLVLFMKRIRPAPGPPGLDFDWFEDDLVLVDNPEADPPDWRYRVRDAGRLHPGIAAAVHQDRVYAFCLRPDGGVALARYTPEWQPLYWSRNGWGERADTLFGGGASEMSLLPTPDGDWLTVYTEGGLGPRIVARRAPRPEGPWSEPVLLYEVPTEEAPLIYAAKAHRFEDGRLLVTYCRNTGDFEQHRTRPELYFPQVLWVEGDCWGQREEAHQLAPRRGSLREAP